MTDSPFTASGKYHVTLDFTVDVEDELAVQTAAATIAHQGSEDGPLGLAILSIEQALLSALVQRVAGESFFEAKDGFRVINPGGSVRITEA